MRSNRRLPHHGLFRGLTHAPEQTCRELVLKAAPALAQRVWAASRKPVQGWPALPAVVPAPQARLGASGWALDAPKVWAQPRPAWGR